MDHASVIGGAQLSLAEHLRALDRTRYEPLVACGGEAPEIVALYRELGVEVHVLSLPRLRRFHPTTIARLFRSAHAVRKLARARQVRLVVTSTARTSYVAAVGLVASGIPVVWWVRDFLFGRRVFRLLAPFTARIICVSDAVRRFYGGGDDPKFAVVVVGSTLYRALESITEDAIRAERARWGFRPEDFVVGYMGRLVEEKGVEDVIAAVASLHARDSRLKLLVVGSGEGQLNTVEERARARVADRGWSFIRFAGFQRNEALYYRLFDTVVLASREHEGYGMSAVQAMMAGTPVVATAVGGTPELVRDRETGLLVPPAAPDRIATALETLIGNPMLRQRLVAAALREVTSNNREQVTTERVESLYDEILVEREHAPMR